MNELPGFPIPHGFDDANLDCSAADPVLNVDALENLAKLP